MYLSDDDGKSWQYKRCIDERESLSYPDVDFHDGRIYLVYDRERSGEGSAREILFASFTEEDIISGGEIEVTVISKPCSERGGCEVIARTCARRNSEAARICGQRSRRVCAEKFRGGADVWAVVQVRI